MFYQIIIKIQGTMRKKRVIVNQCLVVVLSVCCGIMSSCGKNDLASGDVSNAPVVQSKNQDSFLASIEASYSANDVQFVDYFGLSNSDDNLCEWRRFENGVFIHDYVIAFSVDDNMEYNCLLVSQDSIILVSNEGDTIRIANVSVNNDGSTTCSMCTQCGMEVFFEIRLPEGIDLPSLFASGDGTFRAIPIPERIRRTIEKVWHAFSRLLYGDICKRAAEASYNACLEHSGCSPVYFDSHMSLRCEREVGSTADCDRYSYTCPL